MADRANRFEVRSNGRFGQGGGRAARALRWLISGFAVLLFVVLTYGYVQETVGFSRFYEIECTTRTGEDRRCRPTGRYIKVTRVLRDDGQLSHMRVEEFSARHYMEASSEYIDCRVHAANTYTCRQTTTGAITGLASAGLVPWRMVRGQLVNDQAAARGAHYLNVVALWRNRLTLGNFER
jgi:hypothetical protein